MRFAWSLHPPAGAAAVGVEKTARSVKVAHARRCREGWARRAPRKRRAAAREPQVNQTGARTFGVADTDAYWALRQAEGSAGEKRIHRFLASVADRLVPAGGTLLDCAAGGFHVVRLCSPRHLAYAVELSPAAIAASGFPTERVRRADLNHGIPDFGQRFDVIFASMILHWLDVPENFLSAAHERLAPGGRLVVNIPNITHLKYRWQFLWGRFPAVSRSHKNFQTPREFEAMARAGGYTVENCWTPKPAWHARKWPRLFSHDLVYVLRPEAAARRRAA
jgi:SAM-dependent methyltransferase